jgi:hypothetical protein
MKRTILLTVLMVLALTTPSEAFFDKIGMSASIGGLSEHAAGHTDSDHDFYWHSLGIFGRRDFTPNWYGDLEGDSGYMYWRGDHNDHAFSLEARLIIMRRMANWLHLGAGGGLCLLSDSHGHPGLGEKGQYGLITAKVRFPFYTIDNKREYGLDVEADHISGIIDEDSGRNVIKARFYFTF